MLLLVRTPKPLYDGTGWRIVKGVDDDADGTRPVGVDGLGAVALNYYLVYLIAGNREVEVLHGVENARDSEG